jgi:hypothetical protein
VSWAFQRVSVATAILLGMAASGAALAGSSKKEQAPEMQANSAATMTERVQSGNFVYGIIHQIQAQSEELCARYGGPAIA